MKKLENRELELVLAVRDAGGANRSELYIDSNYETNLNGVTRYGTVKNVGFGIFLIEVHVSGNVETGGKGIRDTWYEYVSLQYPGQQASLFQTPDTDENYFDIDITPDGNLQIAWRNLPALSKREWGLGSNYFTIYKVGGDN